MTENRPTDRTNSHSSAQHLSRNSRKQSETIKALRAEITQAQAMEQHLRDLMADLYTQLEQKTNCIGERDSELAEIKTRLTQSLQELDAIKSSKLMRYKQLLVGGAKANSSDRNSGAPAKNEDSQQEESVGNDGPSGNVAKTAAPSKQEDRENELHEKSEQVQSEQVQSEQVQPKQEQTKQDQVKSYRARIHAPLKSNRPKIVHALAHFRMGGSSQLVVDLFERLGHLYDQQLLLLETPDPVAYEGLEYTSALEHRKELEEYLREQNPDMVHIHYWHSPLHEKWYGKVFDAAEAHGCLLVQNVNTPVTPHYTPALDHNVYVSDYVKKTFGKEGEPCSVIYPGSDFKLFDRPSDDPIGDSIGMVYRLQPDKLNLDSINVFIEAAKLSSTAKFLIVGGGKLLAPYKEAVQNANLLDRFEFTDFVSYEDLPSYYRRLRVFVAPIWKESFGQVSPFALHMRVPVVGYATGALPEIVQTASLLAPSGDAKSLGKIAAELFDDPERCKTLGVEARDYAKANFSVETMIEKYQELYAKLVTDDFR